MKNEPQRYIKFSVIDQKTYKLIRLNGSLVKKMGRLSVRYTATT